jgi:hypothetical protein
MSDSIRRYQQLFPKAYFCTSVVQIVLSSIIFNLGLLRVLHKEQQIIFGQKNILRDHCDMPETFKNKTVSGNPLPYSV